MNSTGKEWSINDTDRLYKISQWAQGYYSINSDGHLVVSPKGPSKGTLDLKKLVDELIKRNIHPPILIRFMDILSNRVQQLFHCFEKARKTFEFTGKYYPVFPIKVNQQKQVVESIIKAGKQYNLGLEVGSKAELLVALALAPANRTLIICNGYKDDNFIETALFARNSGKSVFLVVEHLREMEKIVNLSRQLGLKPFIGIRVKLSARIEGRWAESGGDNSKFGLRINELILAIKTLSKNNVLNAFKLIHFHIGSQISDIQHVKIAMTEIARIYTSLYKMGVRIRYVDVGGGLGIDYDGTSSRNTFSVNYTQQEYANDVVYTLKNVCDLERLPHPNIITESGRSLTAHYSVLVTNVFGSSRTIVDSDADLANLSSKHVEDLMEIYEEVNAKNCRELYHDAIFARKEALDLFNMGYIKIEERSKIEELYWKIMEKINILSKAHRLDYQEFDKLDFQLVQTYFLNFSLFQSLPDCWAIDQVFPIVPIERLNERPDVYCILADITCDSDGRVFRYIGEEGTSDMLKLHELQGESEYYVGIFLVGAYQEILGDLHNLFGDTNAVHVVMESENKYRIAHHIKGDRVDEILGYLEYNTKEMVELMRTKLEADVRKGKTSVEDATKFLKFFEKSLHGYSYLQDYKH